MLKYKQNFHNYVKNFLLKMFNSKITTKMISFNCNNMPRTACSFQIFLLSARQEIQGLPILNLLFSPPEPATLLLDKSSYKRATYSATIEMSIHSYRAIFWRYRKMSRICSYWLICNAIKRYGYVQMGEFTALLCLPL